MPNTVSKAPEVSVEFLLIKSQIYGTPSFSLLLAGKNAKQAIITFYYL